MKTKHLYKGTKHTIGASSLKSHRQNTKFTKYGQTTTTNILQVQNEQGSIFKIKHVRCFYPFSRIRSQKLCTNFSILPENI